MNLLHGSVVLHLAVQDGLGKWPEGPVVGEERNSAHRLVEGAYKLGEVALEHADVGRVRHPL